MSFQMSGVQMKAVIGLEVHVQLALRSKLFSSSPMNDLLGANGSVSSYDVSYPSTLPLLNAGAVEVYLPPSYLLMSPSSQLAVRSGLLTSSSLSSSCSFDRKHYFYSDMPAGYQVL